MPNRIREFVVMSCYGEDLYEKYKGKCPMVSPRHKPSASVRGACLSDVVARRPCVVCRKQAECI